MAIVQAREEKKRQTLADVAPQRVDERIMEPGKYEVTPDSTFDVKLNLKTRNGRWQVVDLDSKGIDTQTCVFRMWTYDEMVELRKKATTYDSQRRIHLIDADALNRLKVQKLLISWTFGDENPRLKIHRVQGVLTDESWQTFCKLQTNIIDRILGEMNNVLEYNG